MGENSANQSKTILRAKPKQKYVANMALSLCLVAGMLLLASCNDNQSKAQTAENKTPEVRETPKNEPIANIPASLPSAFTKNCAECHGAKGEGTKKADGLANVTTREEDKLSDEDIVGIMNNPKAFGVSSKMPSFKNKLTEEEKQQIVAWVKTLKAN